VVKKRQVRTAVFSLVPESYLREAGVQKACSAVDEEGTGRVQQCKQPRQAWQVCRYPPPFSGPSTV